jgi:hypothetical protein
MSDEGQGRGLATIVGHNAVQPTSDLRQWPTTAQSRRGSGRMFKEDEIGSFMPIPLKNSAVDRGCF